MESVQPAADAFETRANVMKAIGMQVLSASPTRVVESAAARIEVEAFWQ